MAESGRFADYARRQAAEHPTPSWVGLAALVIGVAVAAGLLIMFVADVVAPSHPSSPIPQRIIDKVNPGVSTPAAGPPPAQPAAPPGPTQVLPRENGDGTATVATAAVKVAEAGAIAEFTGQTSGIPVEPGTSIQAVSTPETATVASVSVTSASPTEVVFSVILAVGPDAVQTPVAASAVVYNQSWVFLPPTTGSG
jgi:hypothetical protein